MSALISSIVAFILGGLAIFGLVPHQQPQPIPQLPQRSAQQLTTKASSGYSDTLTSTIASGVASGNSVDIYIYGPNNGNIGMNGIPVSASELIGPLVFSQMNVPVVNGRWSVTISPSLQGDTVKGWYFYQINVGQPILFSKAQPYSHVGTTMNADGTDYDVLKISGNTAPSNSSFSQSSISVPGMSKYTDPDFGFSFWYPSGWTVTSTNDRVEAYSGDSFLKSIAVSNGTTRILLSEYTSRSGIKIQEGKFLDHLYFDAATHTWMYYASSYSNIDSQQSTNPADVSLNTMGGLHLIVSSIVPLSASKFLVVDANGPRDPVLTLTKTIVATDPSVATPVSAADQIKTIQAEKNAYAGR